MVKFKSCNTPDCFNYGIRQPTSSNTSNFCTKCGVKLDEGSKCECGESIGVYDNFCGNCGRPVK